MGMQFVTEDEPDLTLPENTLFRARLLEIKPRTIEWRDKQSGEHKSRDMLNWWFEILNDNQYKGRKVSAECEAKLTNNPNNRFRQWAETILGRQIPVGMGIDTDDLTGMVCEITVRHEPGSRDPSKVFERVSEILPASAGSFSDEPPF